MPPDEEPNPFDYETALRQYDSPIIYEWEALPVELRDELKKHCDLILQNAIRAGFLSTKTRAPEKGGTYHQFALIGAELSPHEYTRWVSFDGELGVRNYGVLALRSKKTCWFIFKFDVSPAHSRPFNSTFYLTIRNVISDGDVHPGDMIREFLQRNPNGAIHLIRLLCAAKNQHAYGNINFSTSNNIFVELPEITDL